MSLLNKADTTTRNRVKEWINMGQDDFVTRELWPFRETTGTLSLVQSTQEYDLSTNFSDMDEANIVSVALQGASQAKLTYMPFNQLRASRPDFDYDAEGVPRLYYIKGGSIGFWPVPNSAYSVAIDYYKLPTELSGDSDTSIIPKAYRQALIHYAMKMEHDYNTDPDLSLKQENHYEDFVTKARMNLLSQPSDDPFTILGPSDYKNHTGLRQEVR
jgi:hypothetical protein